MPAIGTPAHELVDWHVCTQKDMARLNDGWRSFPSGHSSFAFSGLGYLTLALAGQLQSFRPRTDLARVLIALTPITGAFLVAASRTADYRHDVYDVTAGSLLGIFVAYFGYRRYFRSLRDPHCHTPYPSPGEDINAERHMHPPKDDQETLEARAESFDLNDLTEDEEETQPLTKGKRRESDADR
jgi:diacylglycerol diphosphate phosphatase / phosphatidate phosphatase